MTKAISFQDEDDNEPRSAKGQDGALFVLPIGSGAPTFDGKVINLSGAMSLTWAAGKLSHIDVIEGGVTYRQVFSYTGDDLTSVSAWTPQ